MQVIQ